MNSNPPENFLNPLFYLSCVCACVYIGGGNGEGAVFFQPSFPPSIFVSHLLQGEELFIELSDQSELGFHGCLVGQVVHHAFSFAN